MRFVQTADLLPVGGQREADPESSEIRLAKHRLSVAQDQRGASLHDEHGGRTGEKRLEDVGHQSLRFSSPLVRVYERRTVDSLSGPQVTLQALRGILLEGGVASPALPVSRLEPAVQAQRRHGAVGASPDAVTGRRERVSEARLGDKAGGQAQRASRRGAENRNGPAAKTDCAR